MLSTPRTHLWMLCLVTLPPMASVYLLKSSHYDLSTPNLVVHLFILALWLFSMNNIVYEHYFGPLSDVPMAGGDWFVLAHTPYVFGNIQGLPYLKLVNNMKLDHRGVFRVKGIFHLGGQLVLTAPETINEALNSHCYDYVKPPKPIAFLSRIIGNGLIASEMAEHKAQRKAVWPAFQGHMIRELVPDMWRKSFEFADVIASETDRETAMLEFNGIVSRATLDIIGVSAFGKDFQTLYNSDNRLASVYKKAFDPTPDIIRYFATSMVLPPFMGRWIPMSGNRKITVDSMIMKEQCAQLIAENRAALKESGDGRPDILSLLLKTDLSDEEILDQMLTFLAAGHETTSSASTFAVYLLATHPDIQHRVRKEVRETLSKYRPEELTMQILDSMPYLAAVASEALRVWPTVPVTSRVAVKQTTIAGLTIPPGTHVSIAPITIHRLESLWGKDALVFNPDRWLDPSKTVPGGSTHPLAYIPFLTGPRACIGQVFAKAEMRCLLAAYVERFQFEMFDPNEELSVAGVITIKPRELKLRITDLGSSLKA